MPRNDAILTTDNPYHQRRANRSFPRRVVVASKSIPLPEDVVAVFNSRRGHMQYIGVNAHQQPAVIVCRDRTRRPIGLTGLEAALDEACLQVDASLVPITVVKVDIEPETTTDAEGHIVSNYFARQEEGKAKAACIADGRALDGSKISTAAARRYGYQSVDVCEKIPGARR